MHSSTHRFRAPRAFHPPASLLGRAIRRAVSDVVRAEAAYWVVLVLLGAAGAMASQWGWLWLQGVTPPEAFGAAALRFAAAQAAVVAAFGALAVVGWTPAVEVALTDAAVRLRQGRRALDVPRAALVGVRRLDATAEHRTLRRRADVRRFVARPPAVLLVLDVDDAPPVVLGLPEAERVRFEAVLGPALPTA